MAMRLPRFAPIPALVLAFALSGCLGSGTEGDLETIAGDETLANPLAGLLDGVPCEAASVGGDTSENFLDVGRYDFDAAGHAELDIRGTLAVASTYGNKGFDLVDISDPTMPVLVGSFADARGSSFDVKVTPDLSTVFVGTGPGVDIVDIRDRALPAVIGGWTFPAEEPADLHPITHAHMIYYYEFDEHRLLFVAPQDGSNMYVLKVDGEPGAITLETLTQLEPSKLVGGGLGPHDMWATYDDGLGTHVVYTANGVMGWLAYDLKDPANPQLLGGMVNTDTHQGYVHTIQAVWMGERRLVVTVSEVGVNAMRIWDATNLRAPILLGSWTRDNTQVTALQHNLQIVNGTLFFAHYASGVFAFDLGDVGAVPFGQVQRLVPMGHVAAERSVWDVVVKDGLLHLTDTTALRVVGFGCFAPGDALLTSTG